MTDEEADYWDEYYTTHPLKLGPNGTGFLSQRERRLMGLDELSENYLLTMAMSTGQAPAQIIGGLIREKIAAAVITN
jgi:hypothetical protein